MRHGLTIIAIVALAAAPAFAQDPLTAPDDTYISISGEVESVTADAFVLDYGPGMITVEMDDGDRDADAYKLIRGDDVTVYGFIDDDLFETRTIEASAVYVSDIGTYFYASGIDEEDAYITITTPFDVGAATVQGIVTDVDAEEFTVDSGLRRVRVEVDEMPYNPLDNQGYQRISVGDEVSATGYFDYDFLEGRELVATTVTTLD